MIDELERLNRMWKAGALSDEEFATQKVRLIGGPEAGAGKVPLWSVKWIVGVAGSGFMAMVGAGLVLAVLNGNHAEPASASENTPTAVSTADASAPQEDTQASAADAAPPEQPKELAGPLVLKISCQIHGQLLNTFQCFNGHDGIGDGRFKIRNNGQVTDYSGIDMVQQFRDIPTSITLSRDFAFVMRSSGDDAFTLNAEIYAAGQRVFQDQTKQYGTIKADYDTLTQG